MNQIKIEYQGEIRKIKKPDSYADLIKEIKQKFDDLHDLSDDSQLRLIYSD